MWRRHESSYSLLLNTNRPAASHAPICLCYAKNCYKPAPSTRCAVTSRVRKCAVVWVGGKQEAMTSSINDWLATKTDFSETDDFEFVDCILWQLLQIILSKMAGSMFSRLLVFLVKKLLPSFIHFQCITCAIIKKCSSTVIIVQLLSSLIRRRPSNASITFEYACHVL